MRKGYGDYKEKLKDYINGLNNSDYQSRNGGNPKSDIPDSVNASYKNGEGLIRYSFKSTSVFNALSWYFKNAHGYLLDKIVAYLENEFLPTWSNYIDIISVSCSQEGDYRDDWVTVYVKISIKE